jgi:heat shock protein 4
VIALQKGKLRVMSSAWDRNLGGADFDNVIVDHFVDEIKATKKLDVRTNARAMLRLRLACEKVRMHIARIAI